MKTLIVSICILFYVAYLHAQTNYYTTTKTFNESGYTYQCDIPPYNLVTLYNKSNKWIYVHSIYKDTGKILCKMRLVMVLNYLKATLGHVQNVFLLLIPHFQPVRNKG